MNEGVKIVCDKLLEKPHVVDPNSTCPWHDRRWMRLAEYIVANDDDVFDTEEVQAVHNSIREAKRKTFSAIITDHVVWDTDPQRNEFSPPLVPQTKAEMEEQNRNYQRQQEMEQAARASKRYAFAGQQAGGSGVIGGGSLIGAAGSLLGGP